MSNYTQNVIDIKRNNFKSILNCLRVSDNFNKKQIADSTGLSFATVSNACNLLENAGIIIESDERLQGNVGRAPKSIALNLEQNYILSLSFQNSGLVELHLYNIKCEHLRSTSYCYDLNIGLSDFVAKLLGKYNEFLSQAERDTLIGIGIAVSGIYDIVTGNIVASEFALFENMPLKQLVEDALCKDVFIENDINLCALEVMHSYYYENCIYLYIGEGLGLGAVSNSDIITGHRGYGSEICHIPLGKLEVKCELCGSRKCVQSDLCRNGFIAKYNARTGENINWQQLNKLVGKNDENSVAIVKENAEILGELFSILVNLYDPEVVFIGGIEKEMFDILTPYIKAEIKRRRVVRNAPETDILLDEKSSERSVLGAAQVVYSRWRPNL